MRIEKRNELLYNAKNRKKTGTLFILANMRVGTLLDNNRFNFLNQKSLNLEITREKKFFDQKTPSLCIGPAPRIL